MRNCALNYYGISRARGSRTRSYIVHETVKSNEGAEDEQGYLEEDRQRQYFPQKKSDILNQHESELRLVLFACNCPIPPGTHCSLHNCDKPADRPVILEPDGFILRCGPFGICMPWKLFSHVTNIFFGSKSQRYFIRSKSEALSYAHLSAEEEKFLACLPANFWHEEHASLRRKLLSNIVICASRDLYHVVKGFPEFLAVSERLCCSAHDYRLDTMGVARLIHDTIGSTFVERKASPFKSKYIQQKGLRPTDFLSLPELSPETLEARCHLCQALNTYNGVIPNSYYEYFSSTASIQARLELLQQFHLYQHAEFQNFIRQFPEYEPFMQGLAERLKNDPHFNREFQKIKVGQGNLASFVIAETDHMTNEREQKRIASAKAEALQKIEQSQALCQQFQQGIEKKIELMQARVITPANIKVFKQLHEIKKMVLRAQEIMQQQGTQQGLAYLETSLNSLSDPIGDFNGMIGKIAHTLYEMRSDEFSLFSRPARALPITSTSGTHNTLTQNALSNVDAVVDNAQGWRSFFSQETLDAARQLIKCDPSELAMCLTKLLAGNNSTRQTILTLTGNMEYSFAEGLCFVAQSLDRLGYEEAALQLTSTAIAESKAMLGLIEGVADGIAAGWSAMRPDRIIEAAESFLKLSIQAAAYNDMVQHLTRQALVTGNHDLLDFRNPTNEMAKSIAQTNAAWRELADRNSKMVLDFVHHASAEEWGHLSGNIVGQCVAINITPLKVLREVNRVTQAGEKATQFLERMGETLVRNGLHDRFIAELGLYGLPANNIESLTRGVAKGAQAGEEAGGVGRVKVNLCASETAALSQKVSQVEKAVATSEIKIKVLKKPPKSWGESIKELSDGTKLYASQKDYSIEIMQCIQKFEKNPDKIWDVILKEVMPANKGLMIPESFIIEVQGQKFWVSPNATKHIYEMCGNDDLLNMFKGSFSTPAQQTRYMQSVILDQLYTALEFALEEGLVYDAGIKVGGWDIMFRAPKSVGHYPIIAHAQSLEFRNG